MCANKNTHPLRHLTQSNRPREARHTRTKAEQRLALYLVSHSARKDEDFDEYALHPKTIADVLARKGGAMCAGMRKVTQRLLRKAGKPGIAVDDLIANPTDGEYILYSALTRSVLVAAEREINEYSEREISLSEKKHGRKVRSIVFSQKQKTRNRKPQKSQR